MKLEDIKKNDNNQRLTVYCDLDGVLVDFEKFGKEQIGIDLQAAKTDKKLKNQFWSRATKLGQEGKEFFGAMDPMSDAFELWEYITKYDPIILSATGHHKNAAHEKREWVRRHLGERAANLAIFVTSASDKAQYATPNSILIDDRKKAIDPWVEAGGIGVHHISANDSIEQMKVLRL